MSRFLTRFFSLLWILLLITACQYKPTKVVSQDSVKSAIQGDLTAERIKALNPVILDARSPFEFNLSHVPGAINVRWEDFSQPGARHRGLLQSDLFALARRLSLIGIDPSSKVLVLGKGHEGNGEEGRIAWTLNVLGIKDVYTLVHTSFRAMNPKEEPAPIKNKAYWKPVVDESQRVSLEQFKALVGLGKAMNAHLKISSKKTQATQDQILVLDVRSHEEFKLRNLSQSRDIKVPVININWHEFFNENGSPKTDMKKFLEDQGLSFDKTILVISNHGVRSGAVTMALRSQGYHQSTNFAGGYEELPSF